jgi:hypothetical protein
MITTRCRLHTISCVFDTALLKKSVQSIRISKKFPLNQTWIDSIRIFKKTLEIRDMYCSRSKFNHHGKSPWFFRTKLFITLQLESRICDPSSVIIEGKFWKHVTYVTTRLSCAGMTCTFSSQCNNFSIWFFWKLQRYGIV